MIYGSLKKMSERQTKAGNLEVFILCFLKFSNVFLTFSNVTYSHSHSLSLSHSLTLSHSHTLSISHWITLDMLNNFCFHLYPQNSLSHSLTLSQSLTLTLTHSHTFNLSFNHSRHAEQFLFSCLGSKVTFIGENCNGFFLTTSCEFGVHGAGSQLKIPTTN